MIFGISENEILPVIWTIIKTLIILVGAVLVGALLIWGERRLMALWQDRYGPNRAGPFGLLQVVADMLKIFLKEDWIPPFADKTVFTLAPGIIVFTTLMSFAIIPFSSTWTVADLNVGILFLMAMSSLGVYAVILGGWSSDNKYALLGGMRTAAQMISYEVFMGLSLMGVVLLTGSFKMGDIVEAQRGMWFFIPQFPAFVIFMLAGCAEIHRAPFDLPEAEQELIAGFHTEYSGMKFGMFYVGEYLGIVLISSLITTLFFGGWLGPVLPGFVWFALKTLFFMAFFVLFGTATVRPRYDQLMSFGWKILLPITLVNAAITGAIVVAQG